MTALADQSDKIIAYIYYNMIVVSETEEVIGIILGDCIFGKNGTIKGKYLHKTLYTTDGHILAKEKEAVFKPGTNATIIVQGGWSILMHTGNLVCPWIVPQQSWYSTGALEFLRS